MPPRRDIKKILIVGSGPIVVGQACEFDYSGTQAIKALKKLGYEVVLVNSNPATIMTDPELADRTYIEPLTVAFVEKVIERERPQVMLATLGGQTALNLACALESEGVLSKYGVELIGASAQAIKKAEDRQLFKDAMAQVGLKTAKSVYIDDVTKGAEAATSSIGFPLVLRPSFTLGGLGSSIVFSKDDLAMEIERALELSPVRRVLMEEYLGHWKEFELELMRDHAGNQSVVAAIENFDPMGVHTGDSITVCPIQTLTDAEYQRMREAAFRAYEALGISCGGSNVQFAVNPKDGSMVIIEINPRVSRSSALASKATGFPIAKIAAMLAVGMTLDEITNEITGKTPASFEPSIDYVVVKAPRFHFEKFPGADVTLNTQMKSIGETMGIGRNFLEALQKSLRSLEDGTRGLEAMEAGDQELSALMGKPNARRIFAIYTALARGWTIADVHQLCGVDPWFLNEIKKAADLAQGLKRAPRRINNMLGEAKRLGFSNEQLAALTGASVLKIADLSRVQNRSAVFYEVDTCAAEFEAQTPYYYSTFCSGSGTGPRSSTGDPRKKVIVLGSGPNRIGQGIEFDYVCVHAVEAIREEGLVSIMINSNPETVSTDYDTADRLYFEPLTFEDVARVADREKENLMGVLLGFGGQTPLNLAHRIADALGPRMVLGTPVAQIDASEDRSRFARLLKRLDLAHPKWVLAKDKKEAVRLVDRASRKIPFPVLVRPSYVLGGRGMRIFYDAAALKDHLTGLPEITERSSAIYMDEFLEDAMEIDVDVVGDGRNFSVCGVMEHIEEAGIHSGDSYCVWPPVTLTKRQQEDVEKAALILAKNLGVIGLLNIQFALHRGALHVLEANPRASRTVPFISKARSIPWAKIAAKACLGRALPDLIAPYRKQLESPPGFCAIKAPVFSWERFPGVDIILGPEMRSTGEMMCFGRTFAESFAKAQKALRGNLPSGKKTILFSLKHEDKSKFLGLAKRLAAAGFIIVATKNTARYFRDHGGIDVREVFKIDEGRPHVVDIIANGEVTLVVNTPSHQSKSREDGYAIRNEALLHGIAVVPTPRALEAVLSALNQNGHDPAFIYALQDLSPLNPKV